MKKGIVYIVLVILALSMILPFAVMFLISLTGEVNLSKSVFSLFSLEFYKNVFNSIPIAAYFFNSIIVALLATVGQIIISTLAGYGFARYRFKYSNILFYIFILTMMVPPQVNIVPLFWLMSKLGWVNTYQALVVPALFGGFGVFLMRQYYLGFSKELEEAAKIDGCNEISTFLKIAVPSAVPAIATLSIFTFVANWNSFMWPLIVTNTDNMRTLTVGLAIFKSSFREITMWGELMACAFICSIPVIIIFIIGKKYLINNPLEGAIKG